MKNGKLNFFVESLEDRVDRVCSIDGELLDKSIIYTKSIDRVIIDKILSIKNCYIILPYTRMIIPHVVLESNVVVFAKNPRLEYTKLMIEIEKDLYKKPLYVGIPGGTNSMMVFDSIIDSETTIEPFVLIGRNVKIGKNCIIRSGVKIKDNVTIGDNVIIKSNTVIGGSGFGVETDKDGVTYKVPHIGGVIIEDNVEIGALTTICSGTINPTRIGKHTKIDDHVHIGHNVQIDESVIITACAEVSRSQIGDRTWIGPNSSIIQGVTLGKDSFVGIGAVVTKDVDEGQIVAGNPAQDIEQFKIMRKKLKEL